MASRSPEIDRLSLRFSARVSDDLRRFLDSDIAHSFMRSPVTIMAAIVTLLLFFAALAAPWLAPHDTYDVASLKLMDAFRPPAWADGGDPSFTTDQLGTISAETLIVFGDRDPLYPVAVALDLRQAIPRSWLWIVPNGGHGPVFGPDAPLFVEIALGFLNGRYSSRNS